MKFVLIAVFISATSASGGMGASFQEFDSKKSCEEAMAKSQAMSIELRGPTVAPSKIRFACEPK